MFSLVWALGVIVAEVAGILPAPILLTLAGIYTIAALGLNILTGYTGLISLGHAAFFSIGAYTVSYTTTTLGQPSWLALPLAGIIGDARKSLTAMIMLGEETVMKYAQDEWIPSTT